MLGRAAPSHGIRTSITCTVFACTITVFTLRSNSHDPMAVFQVFIQEHKACEVSLVTHMVTCVTTSLPFLLLLPCLVAVVIIPLCGLNSSGMP